MTTFQQIDTAIAASGITYNSADELFYDGNRPLDPEEVLAVLVEFTTDEVVSYQDDKYDHVRKAK